MKQIKLLDLDLHDYSEDLNALYLEAGWIEKPASRENLRKAMASSYCCFGAFDGEKMIGFFRAISDGVADAYLLDLFVSEKYRNKGIATALIREIVTYLKSNGIEWITCISTPEAEKIYKKIGSVMDNHTPFKF